MFMLKRSRNTSITSDIDSKRVKQCKYDICQQMSNLKISPFAESDVCLTRCQYAHLLNLKKEKINIIHVAQQDNGNGKVVYNMDINHKKYFVKKFRKDDDLNNKLIQIQKCQKTDCIVRMEENLCKSNEDYHFIAMEPMDGDLYDALLESKTISCEEVTRVIFQIARQINNFHSSGYYHGDLKLENFGVKQHSNCREIKLLDFEAAFKLDSPRLGSQSFGTQGLMAPEIARTEDIGI
eukprot:Pgem_evm1s1672